MNEKKRWHAVIKYRGKDWPLENDVYFDELSDIEDYVERGPDWNTIISITINLNIVTDPELTVEEAVGGVTQL